MPTFLSKLPTTWLISIFAVLQGGALFLLFLFFAMPTSLVPKNQQPIGELTEVTVPTELITAKSAVIYDAKTGRVLYSKNADLTLPLASITKLMTAQVVLNTVSESKVVTLSARDVSVEGDAADWNLKVGDTMRIRDIIKLGLAASSNHAMAAAASALGSEYVNDLNKTANDLGLSHTYFLNPTGLDESIETSGAYGSALDVAKLASAFMKDHPVYFADSVTNTVTVPVSGRYISTPATTKSLLDIPGVIGAKTGYTDLAGGNLVVAYDIDINHPLVAVVLGSTQAGRFTDMRVLIEASRKAI